MAKSKPTWRDVKKVLAQWSDDQLVGLVQDLYRLNTGNADFLNARLLANDNDTKNLDPYKKRIRQAISPVEPWKRDVRLSEGRKAICDYKKASGDVRNLLTLMVYYVQCGNDFTLEFGDIDEAFYDSLCSMLEQIKQRMLAEEDAALAAEFLPLLDAEFQRIDGQMGWGYPDEFCEQVTELREHFG